MAPEIFALEPYNKSIDIWSIGVLTYATLVGFPPFDGDTDAEVTILFSILFF